MNGNSGAPHNGPAGAAAYSHAYIVWGGDDDERSDLCRRLAAAMVCTGREKKPCGTCVHCDTATRGVHPDITAVDLAEGKREITVDQIRALRDDTVVMPNEADRKVYIIGPSMNVPAQNALLKVLEEPPGGASFVLSVRSPGELLPTVRSRCAFVSAETAHSADGADDDAFAGEFLEALSDPVKLTELTFKLESLEKDKFIRFIESARNAAARKLKACYCPGGEGAAPADRLIDAVYVLSRAKEYFDLNVGRVHIAGMISAALYSK